MFVCVRGASGGGMWADGVIKSVCFPTPLGVLGCAHHMRTHVVPCDDSGVCDGDDTLRAGGWEAVAVGDFVS